MQYCGMSCIAWADVGVGQPSISPQALVEVRDRVKGIG